MKETFRRCRHMRYRRTNLTSTEGMRDVIETLVMLLIRCHFCGLTLLAKTGGATLIPSWLSLFSSRHVAAVPLSAHINNTVNVGLVLLSFGVRRPDCGCRRCQRNIEEDWLRRTRTLKAMKELSGQGCGIAASAGQFVPKAFIRGITGRLIKQFGHTSRFT